MDKSGKLVRRHEMSFLGAIGIVFLSSAYLMPYISTIDATTSPTTEAAAAAVAVSPAPEISRDVSETLPATSTAEQAEVPPASGPVLTTEPIDPAAVNSPEDTGTASPAMSQ